MEEVSLLQVLKNKGAHSLHLQFYIFVENFLVAFHFFTSLSLKDLEKNLKIRV